MSTSLSNLDYSAIGFSKTMTKEFEDLKRNQADLTQRLDGVVVWYHALLKQKKEAELKAARSAKAAALLAAAAATTTETPAKTESAEEKMAEEEDETSAAAKTGAVEIRRSVSAGQFCETRADLIDAIQEWAIEASQKIATFPSKRSADRIRRTINFINQTKGILRKTTPIGEEEKEEDAVWLGVWVGELDFEVTKTTTTVTTTTPAPMAPRPLAIATAETEVGVSSPRRQVLTRA